MYWVYSHPIRRGYAARLCSWAMFVQLLVFGFLLTIPYLAAYRSGGMWIREAEYREQPNVHFKHSYLVQLRGAAPNSELVWSSFPYYNFLLQNNLRAASVKTRETDLNHDGLLDELSMEISFPLNENEQITSVFAMLFFDYQLHDKADVELEGAAVVQYETASAGRELFSDGFLRLRQERALPHTGTVLDYNGSLIDETSFDPDTYDLASVLQRYNDRNVTTVFEAPASVWTAGRVAGQPFVLRLRVRYPSTVVRYTPSLLHEAKHGWVQYLALLLPLWYFARYLQEFLFANRIVSAVAIEPRLKTA